MQDFKIVNGKLIYTKTANLNESIPVDDNSDNSNNAGKEELDRIKEKKPEDMSDSDKEKLQEEAQKHAKSLYRISKKIVNGQLMVEDPEVLSGIVDRLNKTQKMNLFFDDDKFREEVELKDKIEGLIEDMSLDNLKKIHKIVNRIKNGRDDSESGL